MNILIVASKFPPEYSGPGVRIPRLYNAIKEELGAKDISVICNGIEQINNEIYEHDGFQVQRITASIIRKKHLPFSLALPRLHNALAYFWETILTLRELKKRTDINLLHVIGHSGGTAASIWWAKRHNIPILIELVNATAQPEQKIFFFHKLKLSDNSLIITISKHLEKKCLNAGYRKNKIWCRPNPVSENKFSPETEKKLSYRSDISKFKGSDIVLCSVGKFIPRKNQIFLIDVLKDLPSSYKLILAGPLVDSGPHKERDHAYLSSIYAKVKEYGLNERVLITPYFVESAPYFKAADIYLIPGWDEGLGTPMLESIACATPVVTNDEGAFREWINNGKNGFLCSLETDKWIKAIKNASVIPVEQRLDEAKKIITICGDTVINQSYIKNIRKLTQND